MVYGEINSSFNSSSLTVFYPIDKQIEHLCFFLFHAFSVGTNLNQHRSIGVSTSNLESLEMSVNVDKSYEFTPMIAYLTLGSMSTLHTIWTRAL